MKRTLEIPHGFGVLSRPFGTALAALIIVVAGLTALKQSVSYAATPGKVFARPENAVAALRNATSSADTNALRELFGPAADAVQNPDRVQATNDLEAFHGELIESNRLVRTSD